MCCSCSLIMVMYNIMATLLAMMCATAVVPPPCHSPTTWSLHAGRGVVAFRRWYHGKGQGGPQYFNPGQDVLPPASIPRTQLLDRWGQHTQHCPSCQKVRVGRCLRSHAPAVLGRAQGCLADMTDVCQGTSANQEAGLTAPSGRDFFQSAMNAAHRRHCVSRDPMPCRRCPGRSVCRRR